LCIEIVGLDQIYIPMLGGFANAVVAFLRERNEHEAYEMTEFMIPVPEWSDGTPADRVLTTDLREARLGLPT
jgi:hypothetical protein